MVGGEAGNGAGGALVVSTDPHLHGALVCLWGVLDLRNIRDVLRGPHAQIGCLFFRCSLLQIVAQSFTLGSRALAPPFIRPLASVMIHVC